MVIKSSKPKDRHMVRPDFNNQTEHCFSHLGIKYRNYERCANSMHRIMVVSELPR